MSRLRLATCGLALLIAVAVGGLFFATSDTPEALAYGNGDGTANTHTVIGTPVPFTHPYSAIVQGDYVAGGVGMPASGPPGNGTITLPAAPGGSSIAKAFLYWSVINSGSTPALGQGTIKGNAITGTSSGITASPCWDLGATRQIYNFVADVTSFATFGSNSLQGSRRAVRRSSRAPNHCSKAPR